MADSMRYKKIIHCDDEDIKCGGKLSPEPEKL